MQNIKKALRGVLMDCLAHRCAHPAPNASWYSCYRSCKFGPGHDPPGAGRGCYNLDAPPHRTFGKGCDCASCVDDRNSISLLLQELMSTYSCPVSTIFYTLYPRFAWAKLFPNLGWWHA